MTAAHPFPRRLIGAVGIVSVAVPAILTMAPHTSAAGIRDADRRTGPASFTVAPAMMRTDAAAAAPAGAKSAAVRALDAVRTTPGATTSPEVVAAQREVVASLGKGSAERRQAAQLPSFSQQATVPSGSAGRTVPAGSTARTPNLWAGMHQAQADRELASATTALTTALDRARAAAASKNTAAERKRQVKAKAVAAAQRAKQQAHRQQAVQMRLWAAATAPYTNGKTPLSKLCKIDWKPSKYLRCDALADLRRMNKAYRAAFGSNIVVVDAYRTYAEQVAVKTSRGSFAAPPGTSNHGKAVALDLGGGINIWGSSQRRWMEKHASAYGWQHPGWMRKQHYEPWHWEYQRHR